MDASENKSTFATSCGESWRAKVNTKELNHRVARLYADGPGAGDPGAGVATVDVCSDVRSASDSSSIPPYTCLTTVA